MIGGYGVRPAQGVDFYLIFLDFTLLFYLKRDLLPLKKAI
jgi:hypothetical protein